jgi:hypothetical protein
VLLTLGTDEAQKILHSPAKHIIHDTRYNRQFVKGIKVGSVV